MHPYLCPNCKTNRSRFNIIRQQPQAVRMDPESGQVLSEYDQNGLDPFHTAYRGPDVKVQCGSCGLIEDEKSFTAFAAHNKWNG